MTGQTFTSFSRRNSPDTDYITHLVVAPLSSIELAYSRFMADTNGSLVIPRHPLSPIPTPSSHLDTALLSETSAPFTAPLRFRDCSSRPLKPSLAPNTVSQQLGRVGREN